MSRNQSQGHRHKYNAGDASSSQYHLVGSGGAMTCTDALKYPTPVSDAMSSDPTRYTGQVSQLISSPYEPGVDLPARTI